MVKRPLLKLISISKFTVRLKINSPYRMIRIRPIIRARLLLKIRRAKIVWIPNSPRGSRMMMATPTKAAVCSKQKRSERSARSISSLEWKSTTSEVSLLVCVS